MNPYQDDAQPWSERACHPRRDLCAIVAFGLLCSSVFAQEAQLSGVIADPSGAVVPAARVSALNQETGVKRNTEANRQGYYFLPALPPGMYRVQAQAAGFQVTVREGLKLSVDQNARLDFKLQLAKAQEKVEVVEPVPALLHTGDASLGVAFDTRQIEQLPIEARNVVQLLSLQPGTVYLGENLIGDWRSGSVNGARADQTNVTLDGVDVNDQNNGSPFFSVLRMTQDSVQEFRVITSNASAQEGRSSGAQIALVTKSGTNRSHASLYEYNRNRLFTANDYFLKASQLASGQPNHPANLIRNVFGVTLAGPVKPNRLFFFTNYEGRRDDQAQSIVRLVPTASFRNGTLKYQNTAGSITTLSPGQILTMDPLHIGVNQSALSILRSYPLPNDGTVGDGLNTGGYRFAVSEQSRFDTYIARLDYSLTPDGRQTLFWRGNLQNDKAPAAPEFPGQSPSFINLNNSKGFAFGYTAVLSPQKVNIFRWGLTRQGSESTGSSAAPLVQLGAVDSLYSSARANSLRVPVHNFTDDFSWNHGPHAIQSGANVRLLNDDSRSEVNSFSNAAMVDGYLRGAGIAGHGGSFDPASAGFTPVAGAFEKAYDTALLTAVGIVTYANAIYNYDKTGAALALGSPVSRKYRWTEQEYYTQDTWKIRPNLTLAYGLRWTLSQPPYEVNGTQVGPCARTGQDCTSISLTSWFDQSFQQGLTGGAASNVPPISFAPNGRVNGRPGFWRWDFTNLGPRAGLAWSPEFGGGWLAKLLGSKGSTAIRAGYSLVYDHFGTATVNTYNANGSYGLTTQATNVPGQLTVATAPRFTALTSIPYSLLPPAPGGGFPATPLPNAFAITWGLDSATKTPYSHDVDFAIARDLGHGMVLTSAYAGRFGRRLPEQEDVAMPLDLVDLKSGVDYFTAMSMLSKLAYGKVNINNIQPIPYFQDLFAALNGPRTATQVVYNQVQHNLGNETAALFNLDLPNSQTGAGLNVPGHSYPSFRLPPKEVKLPAVEAQTHRRFVKTHLPVDALVYSPKAKYVYIGRDGRDVLWSLYNHHKMGNETMYDALNNSPGRVGPPLEPPTEDIREYWHQWLDRDGFPYWSFWENVRSWWAIRDLPNILMVHFDTLRRNMPEEMRRIAEFLEIPIDETKWDTIVEHCTFNWMREHGDNIVPLHGAMWIGGTKTFLNQGTNGRWRETLSEAESAEYEARALAEVGRECAHWLATGEISSNAGAWGPNYVFRAPRRRGSIQGV